MALAPSAFAATFEVNSTADTADPAINGSCDTDGGTDDTPCTLRAAIQESNANGGAVVDAIDFNTGAMGVDPTITVAVGTTGSYPAITSEVDINGCSANPNSATPCVGLRSDSAATGIGLNFTVGGVSGAFQASVDGLAMTNWGTAVRYSDFGHGNTTFNMQNNFLGTKLDGSTAEANLGSSIFGSNATIGGSENAAGPTERNVFSNNGSFALQVASGDNTVIQGNLFGTNTAGTGAASPGNSENIEIAGATTIPSFNNPDNTKIGGTVTAGEAATTACDGVCNVIAAATSATQGFGIDLQGESGLSEVPAGPTTIAGNFVGLTADGTAALGNTNTGIRVGNASGITIGGAGMGDPARDRNYITGGSLGISQSVSSDDLTVQNNFVGLTSDGTDAVAPPSFTGVVLGGDVGDPSSFLDNRLVGHPDMGFVLNVQGNGATVQRNVIGIDAEGQNIDGGEVGIAVDGSNNTIGGSTADGNTIGNAPLSAGAANGIQILGSDNTVRGNYVGTDSNGADRGNGASGILIADLGAGGGDDNTIGGDTADTENVISNNGGDAIEIFHPDGSAETADRNEIARNRGSNNGGLFIDLRTAGLTGTGDGFGNPPAGPNGGIDNPDIDAGATSESVSGTSDPGATVRVYRTDSADGTDPNGIVAFVGETTADGSGDWALSCPGAGCAAEAPGSGQFTANQTDASDNSSEFAKAESYTAVPPDTTITSGPSGPTNDTTPTFTFSANEGGSTFECRFDGDPFDACSDGDSHTPPAALGEGPHTFEVRATDPVGNTGAPEDRAFTVQIPQAVQPPTALVPLSNDIGFGKVKRNTKKGTATLTVIVDVAGDISLGGTGVAGISLARASRQVAAGPVELKVKPAKGKRGRKVRRSLRQKGKATVKAQVTFVPTGGTANTETTKVKLIKR